MVQDRFHKLKYFKKILVYIEDARKPDPALDRAVEISLRNNASLKVVSVVAKISPVAGPSGQVANIQPIVKDATFGYLDSRVGQKRREFGIKIEVEVLCGRPAIEITKEVIKNKHDLVIKTSTAERSLEGMVIGTTGIRLMRMCPCPIWIVQREDSTNYQKVLASIDPQNKNDDLLNKRILDLARAVSEMDNIPLYVVYCREDYGEIVRGKDNKLKDSYAKYSKFYEKNARDIFWNFLDQHAKDIPRDNVFLLNGRPETVIPKLIDQKGLDLVVMGTVARTGLPGFFIGNTAEKVLRRIKSSVLAVKPSNFISPIKI